MWAVGRGMWGLQEEEEEDGGRLSGVALAACSGSVPAAAAEREWDGSSDWTSTPSSSAMPCVGSAVAVAVAPAVVVMVLLEKIPRIVVVGSPSTHVCATFGAVGRDAAVRGDLRTAALAPRCGVRDRDK